MGLLVLGAALAGCSESPCDLLAAEYRACSGEAETEAEPADCNEAEEICSQCYLDSAKDVCTELEDIAIDCSDACSQL